MRRYTRIVLVIALAAAACSGGTETTTTASPSPTTSAPLGSTTSLAATTTTVVPSSTTTTQAAAPAPEQPSVFVTVSASLGETDPIEVSVVGVRRPHFSWNVVAGAERYVAIVLDDAGDVVWAWSGESDSVAVGAGEVDRDGVGAFIVAGWLQVVALAGDGSALGSSEPIRVGE